MVRMHGAFTEIRQKRLIDIEVALANGAWAISRCLHLAYEIEQALRNGSGTRAKSTAHARRPAAAHRVSDYLAMCRAIFAVDVAASFPNLEAASLMFQSGSPRDGDGLNVAIGWKILPLESPRFLIEAIEPVHSSPAPIAVIRSFRRDP